MKREVGRTPALRTVSEQMKAWSAALVSELQEWPQVTQKSFFGFTALYRGKCMFGLLPRTRSIFTESAIAFRLQKRSSSVTALLKNDPRIAVFDKDKTRWFSFRLTCDGDLHDAIEYLARAYEAARSSNKIK
jgi:hypothetical protein